MIIGGGLSVNQHGFSRLTSDADLIIRRDFRTEIEAFMSNLGFTNKGSTSVSTLFFSPDLRLQFEDFTIHAIRFRSNHSGEF